MRLNSETKKVPLQGLERKRKGSGAHCTGPGRKFPVPVATVSSTELRDAFR